MSSLTPIGQQINDIWQQIKANPQESKGLTSKMNAILDRAIAHNELTYNDLDILDKLIKDLSKLEGPSSDLVKTVVKAYVRVRDKNVAMDVDGAFSSSAAAAASPQQQIFDAEMLDLQDIPPENMQQILSYLPMGERLKIRRVDTRFNELVSNPAALRAYLASGNPITVKQLLLILSKLGKKGGFHIKHLNLSGLQDKDNFTNNHLKMISDYCPNLKSLQLVGCNRITDVGIQALFSVNRDALEVLNLDSSCQDITDEGFNIIAQSPTPQLRILNLSNCHEMTNTGLIALSKKECPLEELNLANGYNLNRIGFLEFAKKPRPTLMSLNISSLMSNLSDPELIAITQACSNLRALNINGQEWITEGAIITAVQRCRHLQILNCVSNIDIRPLGALFRALEDRSHELQVLRLGRSPIDHEALVQFISIPHRQLRALEIQFPKESGEQDLITLVHNCPNLRELELRGLRITDAVADTLASCSELRVLKLLDAAYISLKEVIRTDHKLEEFTLLDIYAFPTIGAAPIPKTYYLNASCSQGRDIDTVRMSVNNLNPGSGNRIMTLSHGRPLQILEVEKVAENRRITVVDESNCQILASLINETNPKELILRNLIFRDINIVAQSCHNVETLKLFQVEQDISGFDPFLQQCTHLRSLYLSTTLTSHFSGYIRSPIQELTLDLDSENPISGGGLLNTIRSCPDLRTLRLENASGYGELLYVFRDLCPKLERIEVINSSNMTMPDSSFFQGRENLIVSIS